MSQTICYFKHLPMHLTVSDSDVQGSRVWCNQFVCRRLIHCSAAPAFGSQDAHCWCCAHLHSTISWLASELSSAEAQKQLQHALLHSDAAFRLQQQLHSIFAELTHQRLFVSYLLQYCDGNVSEVLDGAACRVGLGDWTEPWANAMRYMACSVFAFSCDVLCKSWLDAPSSHASSLSYANSCSCQVVTSKSLSLANATMTNNAR